MPLYEYVCRDCDKPFSVHQTLAEHERGEVACPECRGKRVERVWSHSEVITSKKS
jgi:putative FmdB family regulatory protein